MTEIRLPTRYSYGGGWLEFTSPAVVPIRRASTDESGLATLLRIEGEEAVYDSPIPLGDQSASGEWIGGVLTNILICDPVGLPLHRGSPIDVELVELIPERIAQLDRIEARLDRIETMLLAQAHPLNTLTRSNRITGHCQCGWSYEAGGPISSKLRHEIQSHHAAHIYELMHPERTTNADG